MLCIESVFTETDVCNKFVNNELFIYKMLEIKQNTPQNKWKKLEYALIFAQNLTP